MVASARVRCSYLLLLIACHHDAPPPAAPAEPPPPCATVGDCTIKASEALDRSDNKTAITMFAQACEFGDQHSCSREGTLLVDADMTKATGLWSTACDGADALGCASLGALYAEGARVAKDDAKAEDFYDKACKLDDAASCGQLGLLQKSLSLADKGCEGGSPVACTITGLGYEAGWSGAPDLDRARDYYSRACDLDDGAGCLRLARVTTDPNEAAKLRTKACSLGIKEACPQ